MKMKHQNLGEKLKATLKRIFIALNTYVRTEEKIES